MSKTQNRIQRLRIIDENLSRSKNGITMSQLIEQVNNTLGMCTDRFAIGRDLKFLSSDLGLEIIEKKINIGRSEDNQQRYVKTYRYRYPDSSLFKIDLNEEERKFLSMAVGMIGLKGVSGLPMFNQLKLKSNTKNSIISHTQNPKEKSISTHFTTLWNHIRKKEVVSINIRDRKPPFDHVRHQVHPWYLREYNRRWFLFGFDHKEKKIKHYALDRIKPPIYCLKIKYKFPDSEQSIENILKDIIGVSLTETSPMEIVFWVADEAIDYVERKPLHSSQEEISQLDSEETKSLKANRVGGKLFKMYCKNNYELRRELLSFGKELIVLFPNELRQQLIQNLKETLAEYA